MKGIIECLATFFYIGRIPKLPGTAGSLAGVVLAWVFYEKLAVILVALCVIGFLIARPAVEIFKTKDPRPFVLDEVCGVMLAAVYLPKDFYVYAAAFLLFRLFDIWKPWPVRALDRMRSPLGIVWDDLAAGLMANLLLQLFVFKFGVTAPL